MVKKNSEQDLYVVLSWMYKYRGCMPKLATKKLLEIDVVRNNFSRSSIYHMMCGVRSYINEGNRTSHLGKVHRQILDRIHLEHENEKPVYTEPVTKKQEAVKLTPEQELQKLKDQYNKLVDLREQRHKQIQEQINKLCNERDLFMQTSGEMMDEITRQIQFLEREVLRGQILKELNNDRQTDNNKIR